MRMEFLKRTWTEVSLDALEYNYHQLRGLVPKGTRFLGVVKADAYGHGAVQISRSLSELGAEYLAVSNLEEAMQLRKAGITRPILILGYTPSGFAGLEAEQGIRQEVNSLEYAQALSAAMAGTGKRLKVHIKLDTGMSRLGFFAYGRPETAGELAGIAKLPGLEVEGAFTHFCTADSLDRECQDFTALQYQRFTALLDELAGLGVQPALRHCCNSAATILHPEYAMDMIRPGVATYGLPPDPSLEGRVSLRPLLSWRAAVAQVKTVPKGAGVSYGRTWTAEQESRIAVLPVGYADGLNRRLSNRVRFLLNGQSIPQIGTICMDMCMLDITGLSGCQVGDVVTVLGRDGDLVSRCQDMAAALGTISYEVVCNISKRVPRLYIQGGKTFGKPFE